MIGAEALAAPCFWAAETTFSIISHVIRQRAASWMATNPVLSGIAKKPSLADSALLLPPEIMACIFDEELLKGKGN